MLVVGWLVKEGQNVDYTRKVAVLKLPLSHYLNEPYLTIYFVVDISSEGLKWVTLCYI